MSNTVPVPRDQVERIIPMLQCFHACNTDEEAQGLKALLAAHPVRPIVPGQRNKLAVGAQLGACNPIPLINGLKEGLDELRAENPNADHPAIFNDPALRLIVHQLAHLFQLGPDMSHEQYVTACRAVGMPE